MAREVQQFKTHPKARHEGGGLTAALCLSTLSALCGMFLFGYNTGVINAPRQDIEDFISKDVYPSRFPGQKVDEDTLSLIFSAIVAVFAAGGILGGIMAGWTADILGRKGGLLLSSVLGAAGALILGCSKWAVSHEMLFAGRIVIGVSCGAFTSLSPLYISEVAPVRLRGALGVCNQLAVTLGLLVSQILGADFAFGQSHSWHWLLGIALVPCVVLLATLPACPESPRYLLLSQNRPEDAVKALLWLRGLPSHASDAVAEEVAEMRAEGAAEHAEQRVTVRQLLADAELRKPLGVAVVLQLSQQLSGINGVLYYSTDVFSKAGLETEAAKNATVGVGAVMVLMTVVSAPLVDRAGRRALMLLGLVGMLVSSLAVTATLGLKEYDFAHPAAVVAVLAYVVLFSVGPGSIPWLITAELFSQGPRPSAVAVATAVNWTANFVVGICFPLLQNSLDYLVFVPFSVLLLVFSLFTAFRVPETKQKTFKEIADSFRDEPAPAVPSGDSQ